MIGMVVRFIVSAIVLMAVSFVMPGISVTGFGGALAAAVVIALLGYLVESVMGDKISPKNRGVVGFLVSAIVIYGTQFIIPQFIQVGIIGAMLAALAIGIIDAFVPTELR
ncbi:putative membrane protein [Desulfitispora alkaliphila]|uniref:phage holin family protein n=1 Tax=Desulfitispora alkaliphila TaxID=622674 RepID=UPI003D206A17